MIFIMAYLWKGFSCGFYDFLHICGNGFCSFLFQFLMVFMVFMIFMILNFLFMPDGNVLHDPKPGPGRAAGAWSAAWLAAWRDEAQDAKSGTEAECSSATRRPQPVRPRRLIYQHKLVME